jgi:hypothetical protein
MNPADLMPRISADCFKSSFHVAISNAKSSTGVLDPPLKTKEPLIRFDQ